MNLSSIDSIGAASIFNSITGSGEQASLWKETLILDPVSNLIDLDNLNDLYNKTKTSLTEEIVNTGVLVKGENPNTIALKGNNSEEAVRYIKFNNNDTINLSGDTSIAIYVNNGENGTQIENFNTIEIGSQSTGIYSISYQNLTSLGTFGSGKIDIKNNGNIIFDLGIKSIGIYADYNKGSRISGEAKVDLSTGTIDLSNSENSIGVYLNEAKLTGTGIINTNAKNVNLFNIKSTSVSVDFSEIAIGTISPGSSYSLGSTDSQITNNSNAKLDNNGVFIRAENSNIMFDTSSIIESNTDTTNQTTLAITGQYAGTNPFTAFILPEFVIIPLLL